MYLTINISLILILNITYTIYNYKVYDIRLGYKRCISFHNNIKYIESKSYNYKHSNLRIP